MWGIVLVFIFGIIFGVIPTSYKIHILFQHSISCYLLGKIYSGNFNGISSLRLVRKLFIYQWLFIGFSKISNTERELTLHESKCLLLVRLIVSSPNAIMIELDECRGTYSLEHFTRILRQTEIWLNIFFSWR